MEGEGEGKRRERRHKPAGAVRSCCKEDNVSPTRLPPVRPQEAQWVKRCLSFSSLPLTSPLYFILAEQTVLTRKGRFLERRVAELKTKLVGTERLAAAETRLKYYTGLASYKIFSALYLHIEPHLFKVHRETSNTACGHVRHLCPS